MNFQAVEMHEWFPFPAAVSLFMIFHFFPFLLPSGGKNSSGEAKCEVLYLLRLSLRVPWVRIAHVTKHTFPHAHTHTLTHTHMRGYRKAADG